MASYRTQNPSPWIPLASAGIPEIDGLPWWFDAEEIPFKPWEGYINLRNTLPPSPPDSMSKSMQELPTCEPTKTKVCWYFVNSICSYGEDCMHSHILPPSRLQPIIEREICRHFREGKCRFGDMCFKLHVL